MALQRHFQNIKVPLAADLGIDQFSGSTITQFSSYTKNAIVVKTGPAPDSRQYVIPRPQFSVGTDNATVGTAEEKQSGRGIFFWEDNDTLYYVNDDTVYRGDYTSVGEITSGYKKTYFTQVGTRIMMTDPENNNAWTIQTDHTLAQITDGDFPGSLAHGTLTINGYGFVMDADGDIYNSDLEDATAWNPLNVRNAERSPDGGIFLGKHHGHAVALGPRSIEFFYFNEQNATGSVLSRREDVFYNVGAISGEAVWQVGDVIYFIGTEAKGSLNVYRLENFQLQKISRYGLNTYLTNLIYRENKGVLFTGFQSQGKTFLLCTPYNSSNEDYASGYYTFVFSPETGLWSWFSSDLTAVGDSNALKIVDWTIRTGTSAALGRGITSTGEIVSVYDVLGVVDIDTSAQYVISDYWVSGYAVGDEEGTTEANVSTVIRTEAQHGGTAQYKYAKSLEVVGDYATTTDHTATIKWSDTDSLDASFTGGNRTINLNRKNKMTRLGRFVRRSFQFEYSGDFPFRLESLELVVGLGGH